MKGQKALFSHKNDEWSTPQKLFDELNKEFCFNLDPCASEENFKCERYFTINDDGLKQNWDGNVFVNPPYSQIKSWMEKCLLEYYRDGERFIVALVPARTDTKWFHEYVYHNCEIRFIKGRLKFGDSKNSAPFPSMIVIWNNRFIHEKES